MRAYDDEEWSIAVARQEGEVEKRDAADAQERFRQEIRRFSRGVELLGNAGYPHVAKAFSLMNRAMQVASTGRFAEWHLSRLYLSYRKSQSWPAANTRGWRS